MVSMHTIMISTSSSSTTTWQYSNLIITQSIHSASKQANNYYKFLIFLLIKIWLTIFIFVFFCSYSKSLEKKLDGGFWFHQLIFESFPSGIVVVVVAIFKFFSSLTRCIYRIQSLVWRHFEFWISTFKNLLRNSLLT